MTTTMMMMVDCIRESGYIVVRITAPWSTYDMRADDQLTNVREANDDTHTKKKQRRIVECIALANLCSPKRLVISLLLCWTSMICTSTICSSPNVKLSISQQTKHIIFIHEKRFVDPRTRTKWRSIQCYFSVDTEKKIERKYHVPRRAWPQHHNGDDIELLCAEKYGAPWQQCRGSKQKKKNTHSTLDKEEQSTFFCIVCARDKNHQMNKINGIRARAHAIWFFLLILSSQSPSCAASAWCLLFFRIYLNVIGEYGHFVFQFHPAGPRYRAKRA